MKPYIKKYTEIPGQQIEREGIVKGVTKRVVIGPEQHAERFHMRVFTLQPEGHSPFHTHDWEHEVFVLKGEGVLVTQEEKMESKLSAGDVAYVPPGLLHQFRNASEHAEFEFICVVPSFGE